jgi:hypothetical protein
MVLVVASTLVATHQGGDVREEELRASAPGACAREGGCDVESSSRSDSVTLSGGSSVWPYESSNADRSSAASVASAFIAEVTGEDPADVVERPSDAPGPAPTTVVVRLRSGASVDVFTAPEGERGWRVVAAGQPTAAGPSGAVQADFLIGPVDPGNATSQVQVRFSPPPGSATGMVYYSTPDGTFAAELDTQTLRTHRIVLPEASLATSVGPGPGGDLRRNHVGVGAVVLVFRNGDGEVLFVRGVHMG